MLEVRGAEVRECAQCGNQFTPEREHARFCSARCRMAWNDEHAGIAAAPAPAIGWSVAAMTETARQLSSSRTWDLTALADAVADAVWRVTVVDATLVRYHPRNYETTLEGRSTRRRETEQTLEGLRYVRNQLGRSVSPADLIMPPAEGSSTWTWRSLPQPDTSRMGPRARKWELSRYHAYQARLAGQDITAAFTWCAEFLALAARLAGGGTTPG